MRESLMGSRPPRRVNIDSSVPRQGGCVTTMIHHLIGDRLSQTWGNAPRTPRLILRVIGFGMLVSA